MTVKELMERVGSNATGRVVAYVKDGLEEFNIFMSAPVAEKEKMLKQYAGDTDDALWRSEEWMRISDARRP